MYKIREEIKAADYTFDIGPFHFPFYKLVDHFYPLNDKVYNYLNDDRACDLYSEYAALKENYANFDYELCRQGCEQGYIEAPPCESCNGVFMSCAFEKADSLLHGVQFLLNAWRVSLDNEEGFPYTAAEMIAADGETNLALRDSLSGPLFYLEVIDIRIL